MNSDTINVRLRTGVLLAEADSLLEAVTRTRCVDHLPQSLVERIGEIAGEMVAVGDVETMAAYKWRLSRLRWRLEESGNINTALHGAVRSSVSSLRVGSEVTSQTPTKLNRRLTVDCQVLNALIERPKRPSTLADELGLYQSQISRSLRSLRTKGRVIRISAPTWEEDSRGQWYALMGSPL
jgi:hypothetical protein